MATNSVDLLSVIQGLQVTADDILQAELYLSQALLSNDPTMDIRTGTAVRDLAIRPNATLLALINKGLQYYWSQNSLADVTDSTPTDFVDKILSNYFMTRYTGSQAIISVRFYFAKQISISLTTDMFFSPDNTLRFYPIVSSTYDSSQLTFDSSSNQYYIDIDLEAESVGTTYNISAGSLIYYSTFNPYFLHAEINYLKSTSVNAETNTQFIARAQTAISTRNLINTPSITSNLQDNFNMIANVVSLGFGDVGMIRDKILVVPPTIGSNVWVHGGGYTDIYCDVPLTTALTQFTTSATGTISLTGPIYNVTISSIPGGPNVDTITPTDPFYITNNYLIRTSLAVNSINRSGTVVTVTMPNHGLEVGERFLIEEATPADYNSSNIPWFVASVIDANNFTFNIATTPTTPATGSPIVTTVDRANEVGFSTLQSMTVTIGDPSGFKPISTATWSTGPIIIVNVPAHGYTTGNTVVVKDLVATQNFNGTFQITVLSPDTFQYNVPGTTAEGISTTFATVEKLLPNQSVSLNIDYFQNIDGIQTYLESSANRVLSANQLARGFNLTMLDVTITGYGGTAPSQATSSTIVTKYCSSLAPGQPFIMADLLAELYAAGITTIKTPLAITYTKYYRDLLSPVYGSITDALNPNDTTNVFKLNTLTTSVATL